jgi:hypothetical protein
MMRWIYRVAVLAGAALGAVSTAAIAQLGPTTKYTTFKATAGKALEVANYAAAGPNCTPAPAPGPAIHVVESPKSGTLTVRVAELVYNVSSCPPIKMPAQVLSYEANDSGTDRDHFVYDVTNAKGEVTIYDVTIEITTAPAKAPNVPSREQKF